MNKKNVSAKRLDKDMRCKLLVEESSDTVTKGSVSKNGGFCPTRKYEVQYLRVIIV